MAAEIGEYSLLVCLLGPEDGRHGVPVVARDLSIVSMFELCWRSSLRF